MNSTVTAARTSNLNGVLKLHNGNQVLISKCSKLNKAVHRNMESQNVDGYHDKKASTTFLRIPSTDNVSRLADRQYLIGSHVKRTSHFAEDIRETSNNEPA
jgi:hypothetical protein